MQTILTIKQQNEFLDNNWKNKTLSHKWSCNGMGNSKILNGRGEVIGKAGGCGYDRYGAALGNAITSLFPAELLKLAKRECKGKRRTYKKAAKFYGLFYNAVENKAWLDGACGSSCMERVLNKIGFTLQYVGETDNTKNTGEAFYTLQPLSSLARKYFN